MPNHLATLAETGLAGLSGLIPIGLLMLVGLALWAAGRRLMRPAFAVGGLVVGYLVGQGLATAVALEMGDWVVGAAVGLVAASLAILVYRLAVTVVLAVVLGVAAPLAVMTTAELGVLKADAQASRSGETAGQDVARAGPTDPEEEDPGAWLTARDASGDDVEEPDLAAHDLDEHPGDAVSARPSTPDLIALAPLAIPELTLPPATAEQLAKAGSWLEKMAEGVAQEWREAPEPMRPTILIAAVCGALTGVILGTASATLSATIVSAFGGSLILLAGGRAAIEIIGDGLERLVPASSSTMLLAWLVLAVMGLAIQWTLRPDPADKSA